ncbi:hypothetical protein ACFOZY_12525 [Chungangia koreensis]|uniref:Uncharacterized protein n=1 Tax=Chungangia koreensis TaxID=752657 RepID=A0ABV8XA38_9LACT
MKRDLPLMLGAVSILLAILPFFPRIFFAIGALAGFLGIVLTFNDMKRYRRQHTNMLRVAQGLCFVGTAACVFILIYFV